MSANDFFDNKFSLKKKNVSKNFYIIPKNQYNYHNNNFNLITNLLNNSLDYNIINIIKNYYLPLKNKLLIINNDNIHKIKSIDDNVTAISCFNLNLEYLPDYIYKAKNLISLNCSFNKIKYFKNSPIFENLLMLNCNFNNIQELPDNLYNLKELYCNYNKIYYLPPLPNINLISCINNNIKIITPRRYPFLKYFYSYWNSESLDIISKKVNNIIN